MGENAATTKTHPVDRRKAQTAKAIQARKDNARRRRLEAAAAMLREAGWGVSAPE